VREASVFAAAPKNWLAKAEDSVVKALDSVVVILFKIMSRTVLYVSKNVPELSESTRMQEINAL